MARRKFNLKPLPAQRLYLVLPNPKQSIVKQRARLFLANGSEIRNLVSVTQEGEIESYLFESMERQACIGRGPLTLTISRADLRIVKTIPRKKRRAKA